MHRCLYVDGGVRKHRVDRGERAGIKAQHCGHRRGQGTGHAPADHQGSQGSERDDGHLSEHLKRKDS